ncbi:MAG: MoaD family protein [Candidatus Thermoplasmatota archaeon]
MKVKVKFYSLHREITGKNEIYLEVEKGKKLKDVLKLIFENYPELEKLKDFTFASLNHKYANGEEIINEEDEIAIFPPVGGG